MKKLTAVLVLVIAALMAIGFSGCSTTEETKFEDVKWTLESYGDKDDPQPVITDSIVTATFDSAEKQISGKASCNSYFGGYETDDGLTVGMLGNTEMYCGEPEGIMDQEMEYLTILGQAEDYTVENDTLTIECGDSVLIFTLDAAE